MSRVSARAGGARARSVLLLSLAAVVLSSPAWGADDDAALLDLLLRNGSISQAQYDELKAGAARRGGEAEPAAREADDAGGDEAEAGGAEEAGGDVGEPGGADDVEGREAEPGGAASADDRRISEKVAGAVAARVEERLPARVSYGKDGFRLETLDGNWQLNIQLRGQFRFTYPRLADPRQVADFESDNAATFEARRLRLKLGGHAFRPWLGYYFEIDLQPNRDVDSDIDSASVRMLDGRVDVVPFEALGLRVGQWKIDYNRERVDSSAKQQFVERSIVNRIFTIDRQVGLQLRGRLFEGTPADLRYYAGIFTGEGRATVNDDTRLLYAGRLQWNLLGRDVPLSQTDVERSERWLAALGAGVAYNVGRCTRWSSSGCGNLDGYEPPETAFDGRFRILQAVQDLAIKRQGFSIQQEFHWKRVDDRGLDTSNDLFGTYAQAGYFFHGVWARFPKPLELAFRYAWLREPNELDRAVGNERQEFSAAANWFFVGHRNKLTLDYSYLTLDDPVLGRRPDDHRVRFQWDVAL